MREILFRAKTSSEISGYSKIEDGTWVYGFYRDKIGLPVISQFEFERGDNIDYEIDRNTLGQFTGLLDNHGKPIYEGDIVEFETNVNCITNELKPYWKDCYEKSYAVGGGTWWVRKDQAVVQWNQTKGKYDLKVYNNKRYKRKSDLFTYRQSGYVVVGNIYDNPELVEEIK